MSKKILFIFQLTAIIFFASCTKGYEKDLRDKWKFEKYIFADGTAQRVDSVFLNFMKGSASANIIKDNSQSFTLYGGYAIFGDSIKIQFRSPENEPTESQRADNEKYFSKYFNWSSHTEKFRIQKLTSKDLELSKRDTIMILTKY